MNDVSDSVAESAERFLGNSRFAHLFISGFISWITFLSLLRVVTGELPAPLDTLREYVFWLACGFSLLVTFIAVVRHHAPRAVVWSSIKMTAAFAMFLIIIAIPASNLPGLVDQNQFDTAVADLASSGLNPTQIAQLEKVLADNGYVTAEDINAIISDDRIRRNVIGVLADFDFMTRAEMASILNNEDVQAAIADANSSVCVLQPLPQYSNVAVRDKPDVDEGNLLRAIYQGDRIIAIGHNGGEINTNLWWLVKVELSNGREAEGWIASSVVEEISQAACALLGESRGQ